MTTTKTVTRESAPHTYDDDLGPLVRVHTELGKFRLGPTRVKRARTNVAEGRVAFDPFDILRAAGDLDASLSRVAMAFEMCGLASDFHTSADVGDFSFGTRFAFNWGAGIRWVPGGGRFQFRLDYINHLYSVGYPESYYVPAPDQTQILAPSQKRSAWLNNPAFTIGVSYLFSR